MPRVEFVKTEPRDASAEHTHIYRDSSTSCLDYNETTSGIK